MIKTITRSVRDLDGTTRRTSSATCLTIKACYYLGKMGIGWAWEQAKRLHKKYLPEYLPDKDSNLKLITHPSPTNRDKTNPMKTAAGQAFLESIYKVTPDGCK